MNTAPNSIDCKLMNASFCAYLVNLSGTFTPPDPKDKPSLDIYNNLGIIGKVQAFTNKGTIFAKINAAILVETSIGYILAFRGTLPFSTKHHDLALIEDWGQDILESDTVIGDGLPGKVHEGFYNAFNDLWPKIEDSLNKIYKGTGNTKPLYITGHSKGGPMASYAAYKSHTNGYPFGGISTFASPFPGNADFAAAYNSVISQVRYEYTLDIVPFLPPQSSVIKSWQTDIDLLMDALEIAFPSKKSYFEDIKGFIVKLLTLDYQHVGKLQYIDANFQVVNDSPGLLDTRIKEFKTLLEQHPIKGIGMIGKHHSIACGGGYQRGTCSGVCGAS